MIITGQELPQDEPRLSRDPSRQKKGTGRPTLSHPRSPGLSDSVPLDRRPGCRRQ